MSYYAGVDYSVFKIKRKWIKVVCVFLILCALISISGCASDLADPKGAPSSSGLSSSGLDASDTATSSASITEEPVPAEQYTFDLEGDLFPVPEEGALQFFSNCGEIAIYGGEGGMYRLSGHYIPIQEYLGLSLMGVSNAMYQYIPGFMTHAYSLDKTSVLFMTNYMEKVEYVDNEYYYTPTEIGELMYYNGKEAISLSENVICYSLSSDGTSAAYIKQEKSTDEKGECWVFDTNSGEYFLISQKALRSIAISPDGGTIMYTESDDLNQQIAYICAVGGESIAFGKDRFPIAISNGAETVYYIREFENKSQLWVSYQGEERLLLENISSIPTGDSYSYYTNTKDMLLFNADSTQIIYNDGANYYFSVEARSPIKVVGGDVSTSGLYSDYANITGYFARSFSSGIRFCRVINKKNLCNLLFDGFLNSTYFDENMIVRELDNKITSDAFYGIGNSGYVYREVDTTTDACFTYYLKDSNDPSCLPVQIGDEYTQNTVLTANGNLYYDNDIGQIYRYEENGDPERIATYSSLITSMTYQNTTYLYFYTIKSSDMTYYTKCDIYCLEDKDGAIPVLIDTGIDCGEWYSTDVGILFEKHIQKKGYVSTLVYASEDGVTFEEVTLIDDLSNP
jgi:hypothetical protein